jgi:hypothetical protein
MDRSAHQRFCFRRFCRRRHLLAERSSELIGGIRKATSVFEISGRNIRQEIETPFVLDERTGDKIFRAAPD